MSLTPKAQAQLIGAGVQFAQGLYAQGQANSLNEDIRNYQADIDELIDSRTNPIDPSSGATEFQGTDLSGMIRNPYENLRVASKAAEIQMEQTDIALANTLDTLRVSGMGAGGATALAQAAAQGKSGIAASIEQQEVANEKMRAQGESQMQQMKMQEQQRLQGISQQEGARVQGMQMQGAQFQAAMTEDRLNADLDRAQGMLDNEKANQQNLSNQAFGAFGDAAAGFAQIDFG